MKLRVWDLTYIAEDLDRRSPPPLRYLAALARHADPVVREGAIYGLAHDREDPRVAAVLRSLVDDPSPVIRTTAQEALDP